MAYTTFGFDGAMVTATRPQGFAGSPLALLSSSSFQVVPPSAVWKKPLPLAAAGLSPPERKVQPFRRKSHMPAKSTFGSCGFMEIIEQPVERFAPAFAAVGRFVNAAVLAVAPQFSRHADVNRVAVLRIDNNFRNALRILQPHVGPAVAAVRRLVDAVADRHAVARPRFAGSGPNRFRRLWINGHRANGLRRLFVKNRLECRAAVRGFPYAPAGGSNVDSKPAILFYGGDRGHAPAHGGGADVSRTKTRDRVRIEFTFLRRCSPGKNHRREKHHHPGSKAANCLAHIGGFLSNKVEATALGHKSIVRGTGISSCPLVRNHFPAGGAFISGLETGIEKCASSSGIFCSIFSTEICERDALPFCACSTAKG